MKSIPVPMALIVLAAFLAPILGGQVSLDQVSLASSELLRAILGGPEVPLLSHAIVGLSASAAMILLLSKRRIVQVPNGTLSSIVMAFFAVLALSTLVSDFKWNSIATAAEWLCYGIGFYAVVAGTGRKQGPMLVIAAIVAGCTVLALLGILEYGQYKAVDPSHRIFSLYNNPNALAGMLLVGLFLGLTLLTVTNGLEALVAGVACLGIGIALVLTGSKGGLLALIVGLAAFFATQIGWKRDSKIGVPMARVGSVLVVVVLVIAFAQHQAANFTNHGPSAGAPLTRISDASESSDQSAGFRILLWKGCLQLVKADPVGSGIGTYQFESARSGLTTQTHFAHETYLQLMVEGSPVLPGLLLVIAGFWMFHVFRGSRRLPSDQNRLRSGVVAAVVAVGVHNMVDSDLYFFGIGFTFFVLLGLGLLLGADAVAPENVPAVVRRVAAALVGVLALAMLVLGVEEMDKSELRSALYTQNRTDAMSISSSLQSLGAFDGEAWSLIASTAASPEEQAASVERSASLAPSARNLRALARVQLSKGETAKAIETYREILRKADPNNMPALLQLAQLYASTGDASDAMQTYERLIAVEQSPYFQVRSLPDMIPTETYTARVQLAAMESSRDQKVQLLSAAVGGFEQYLKRTFQQVKDYAAANIGSFGGETLPGAVEKMQKASDAAKQLADLYRAAGDPAKAADADRAAADFAAVSSESK